MKLLIMGDTLQNKESSFTALTERGRPTRYRSEVLKEMVERKQTEGEYITSYADIIYKLALCLKADMK